MAVAKDIAGQRFGHLLVLDEKKSVLRKSGSNKVVKWKCRCDCGNVVWVMSPNLLREKTGTKSCGCINRNLNRFQKLAPGLANLNSLYDDYRRKALDRKLEFSLSKEDFEFIIKMHCFYCGQPPSKSRGKSKNGILICNGVDRVNNNVGYLLENCVASCSTCNRAKFQMTHDEFLDWIRRIYQWCFSS
jgi:hypothetical protein